MGCRGARGSSKGVCSSRAILAAFAPLLLPAVCQAFRARFHATLGSACFGVQGRGSGG